MGIRARHRRAVFLDRDGTVNEEVDHLSDPRKLRLLPGVGEALRLLREAGFLLVLVANQSAVARGLCEERTVRDIHRALQAELAASGARMDAAYYCPHHPSVGVAPYRTDCACRKPRPGLILRACADLGIDASRSFLVGDKLSDVEAGKRAGCRSILILSGHGTEEAARIPGGRALSTPDHVTGSLFAAAAWIVGSVGETARR